MYHLQNRRAEPKSRATTAKTETNEGENEPDPDVGLGAGASAAMAEAVRAQTTRERSIRKFIEEAIVDWLLKSLKIFFLSFKSKENFEILRVVRIVR